MQSIQRQFGKYMKRSADEGQISVLLKDFDDADQLLQRIIDASKAWRDSWISILTYQHRLVNEFEILYAPIVGAGEDYHGHVPVETSERQMTRTIRMRGEYEDLKRDLMDEINMVDAKMIKPAQEAKDYLQPLKKVIKKREDRKLDYERYQGRVDTGRKKIKKTDRDTAALAKAESDLIAATEAYNLADDHLRSSLPRIISVTFSLLPHLLAAQIQIQNTLLAHYYTMLHNYCTEENFPSPAPPMDEVIRVWDDKLKPTQREIESIAILAHGKSVKTGMNGHNGIHTNGYNRRPSGQSSMNRVPSVSPARGLPPSPDPNTMPKILSIPSPSASSLLSPSAIATPSSESVIISPTPSDYHSTPSWTPGFSPAAPRTDYFSRDRQPSASSLSSSVIAAKKKPPPPPPRIPSSSFVFVTALYDFAGQGEGDLVFREGDKIKVLKKTESTDDWWQGELRGVKGQFPANYCQKL